MSKVVSERTKTPEIPDEQDLFAEVARLRTENATLQTKLAQATDDYSRMRDSIPSFEKAVATRVAQLGIGRDPSATERTAQLTAGESPVSPEMNAYLAALKISRK
jgi:hypothetical protein